MSYSGVENLFPAGARIERIFTAPELDSGAVLPSGWDAPGMTLCKQRSYGRAVRGNGVFLKEYIYTSWFRRLRRTLSEPRPFIALAAARRLAELGIPTPAVLAAVRTRRPGEIRDLLVTRELSCEVCYGDGLAKCLTDAGMLINELTPVVAKMHLGGLRHGDLSLRNWYRDAYGKWGLIDLDGAAVGPVSAVWRMKELARLVCDSFCRLRQGGGSVAELEELVGRFLTAYTEAGGGPVGRARLLSRTLKLVNRFRRKYLKLGRL